MSLALVRSRAARRHERPDRDRRGTSARQRPPSALWALPTPRSARRGTGYAPPCRPPLSSFRKGAYRQSRAGRSSQGRRSASICRSRSASWSPRARSRRSGSTSMSSSASCRCRASFGRCGGAGHGLRGGARGAHPDPACGQRRGGRAGAGAADPAGQLPARSVPTSMA